MKKQLEAVKVFHETFRHPVSEKPVLSLDNSKTDPRLINQRETLRFTLMKEENEEYLEAVKNKDLTGVADALGDMLYILCGTILEHGLQDKIEKVFDEIQRSNMSKLDKNGKPIYREDGKILKGENYSKPDIKNILEQRHLISIAAISKNDVLAKDGKIPWHLPNDFAMFKKETEGHHIIMGRKTFESLPKLLSNRVHVVITRNKDLVIGTLIGQPKVIVVHSLEEAISVCPSGEKSFIIGGGEIYEQAMPFINELYLTIVDMMVSGKNRTMFPSPDKVMGTFDYVSNVFHPVDEKHKVAFSFLRLKRK